jgi:hypothetical protein
MAKLIKAKPITIKLTMVIFIIVKLLMAKVAIIKLYMAKKW